MGRSTTNRYTRPFIKEGRRGSCDPCWGRTSTFHAMCLLDNVKSGEAPAGLSGQSSGLVSLAGSFPSSPAEFFLKRSSQPQPFGDHPLKLERYIDSAWQLIRSRLKCVFPSSVVVLRRLSPRELRRADPSTRGGRFRSSSAHSRPERIFQPAAQAFFLQPLAARNRLKVIVVLCKYIRS